MLHVVQSIDVLGHSHVFQRTVFFHMEIQMEWRQIHIQNHHEVKLYHVHSQLVSRGVLALYILHTSTM